MINPLPPAWSVRHRSPPPTVIGIEVGCFLSQAAGKGRGPGVLTPGIEGPRCQLAEKGRNWCWYGRW